MDVTLRKNEQSKANKAKVKSKKAKVKDKNTTDQNKAKAKNGSQRSVFLLFAFA
jgi:hypothetical protein